MRVEDVAHEVGFSDHNYFIKIFKKAKGHTPRAYREKEFTRVVDNREFYLQFTPEVTQETVQREEEEP
ncbi:MAG: AraC family transcriptional regulator [Lachnospiraceae bacterium]|nr:AraC family transcriptional regulator [Lachnospiraceae bacterium]